MLLGGDVAFFHKMFRGCLVSDDNYTLKRFLELGEGGLELLFDKPLSLDDLVRFVEGAG